MPITPTFVNNNGIGDINDALAAINAKFKEPVSTPYSNLGIQFTDNKTTYTVGTAVSYNVDEVRVVIDMNEYLVGIPADLSGLVTLLNGVLDIGRFYLDGDSNIVAEGFHDFGNIIKTVAGVETVLFVPGVPVAGTNIPTIRDIVAELALKSKVTVTPFTFTPQATNTVLAGPTSGFDIPTFRTLSFTQLNDTYNYSGNAGTFGMVDDTEQVQLPVSIFPVPPIFVKAATFDPLPAYTYNNHGSGIGAFITITAHGAPPDIDGVPMSINDVFLLRNGTSNFHNGVYQWLSGSSSVSAIAKRISAADETAEFYPQVVFVRSGNNYGRRLLQQQTVAPVIGTSDIIYAPYGSPAAMTSAWAPGGNFFGADTNIGMKDNFAMRFITHNIERMAILNSGKVGIGTTAPNTQLHIDAGTTNMAVRITSSSSQTFQIGAYNATPESAVSGTPGSIISDTTNGNVYLKASGGSTVGWQMVATVTGTQTFTNKTLTSPVLTTPDIGVATGTSLAVNGTAGAGFLELRAQTTAPGVGATNSVRLYSLLGNFSWKKQSDGFERRFTSTITADRIYTWPDASDTVAVLATAQTFTNKTITASTNIIGGVTMTLGSDASYDLYYRGASGVLTRLANTGTTGFVLTGTAGAQPSWQVAPGAGGGGGDALTANPLSQFASTTSAQLKTVISDETGSGGALVFATSPTLTTFLFVTSMTASGSAVITTDTTSGHTLKLQGYTGSAYTDLLTITNAATPTIVLVTPNIGVATATSVNKVTITAPTTSSTLTIDDGFTLHVSANATVAGTNTGDQTLSGLGGASTALDNLAAVSINTTLLAQTGVDLGSTTKPFRDLYLFGGGTYATTYFKFTGTPTSTRTLTIPDATDTFGLLAASQAFTNKTYNGLTVTATAGTLTIPNNASAALVTSGNFSMTLIATATTSVTLPTSGTLVSSVTTGNGVSASNTAGALAFTLGAITPTTVNGVTISTSTGTLTLTNGKVLSVANTLTFTGTDSSSVAFGTGGTVAYVANKLSVFAATSSSELAGVISDETGSGLLVFSSLPTVQLASASTAVTQSPFDNSTKIATTAYVDAAVIGLDAKDSVDYASTSALPANTYANGSSGVGATLTGNVNGPLIIDGVTLLVGQVGRRILVAGEATQANNGWYTLTQVGVIAVSPYILTRATDSDQAAEIGPGYFTSVIAPNTVTPGSSNNGKVFISVAADPFVVGTTALTFSQVGSVYSAGNGLSLSGTTFSIDTSITADLTTAQTFTNKTLTSPKINENVALTTTATKLNFLTSAAGTTGTASTNIVFSTSPTLVTPVLGAATATSINSLTITTSTGTLTITNAKVISFSNTLTFAGTDSTTMTFPTTSATIARTDAANTFTGHQTIEGVTSTGATGTGKFVFDTSPGFTTAANPVSDGGAALGTTSLGWSNIFLVSGATLNFSNGNAVLTHSSAILTVSTGDLRVTTAGTNTASVVTVGGAQTLTGKTIGVTQLNGAANTMAVNNTASPANYTTTTWNDVNLKTYAGTITWDGTAPTTIVSQQYGFLVKGGECTLILAVVYTNAGASNTTVTFTLPTDCPTPATIAGVGVAANEVMYIGNGRYGTSTTQQPAATRTWLSVNSGNNGYIITIFGASAAAKAANFTMTYRVS